METKGCSTFIQCFTWSRSVIHDSQKKSLQDSLRLTPWFIPKSLMLSSCKIRLQEKEQFQASPGIEHLPPRYYLGSTSNWAKKLRFESSCSWNFTGLFSTFTSAWIFSSVEFHQQVKKNFFHEPFNHYEGQTYNFSLQNHPSITH